MVSPCVNSARFADCPGSCRWPKTEYSEQPDLASLDKTYSPQACKPSTSQDCDPLGGSDHKRHTLFLHMLLLIGAIYLRGPRLISSENWYCISKLVGISKWRLNSYDNIGILMKWWFFLVYFQPYGPKVTTLLTITPQQQSFRNGLRNRAVVVHAF